MPVEIYFKDANHKCEEHKHEHKDGEEHDEHECECKKPINETSPLWIKNPSSCTKEEYTEFYRRVFKDYKEPLFYIHINADYPLNFKGILYFPKINSQFDSLEGQVKLFYNQVFVADNIKEVIPEYLLMLKGVVDCPELPLNVSRSYLQNSGYVSKISAHIVKKVGDKLSSLYNTERESYENFWEDIKTFILYGCLRDQKFFDRVKDIILYKNTQGKYKTLGEYIKTIEGEPENVTVYYTNNPAAQAVYVNMHQRAGREVFILENMIETQFINLVEMNGGDKPKIKFVRVDSDIESGAEDGKEDKKDKKEKKAEDKKYAKLINLFKEAAGNREKLKIETKALSDGKIPAILTLSEEKRRMSDMIKQYKAVDFNMFNLPEAEDEETLILNTNNALIQKLSETENKDAAEYIYMLSLISKRELNAEELEKFIERGVDLCGKIL
jgi:molecular chaperone HtpG